MQAAFLLEWNILPIHRVLWGRRFWIYISSHDDHRTGHHGILDCDKTLAWFEFDMNTIFTEASTTTAGIVSRCPMSASVSSYCWWNISCCSCYTTGLQFLFVRSHVPWSVMDMRDELIWWGMWPPTFSQMVRVHQQTVWMCKVTLTKRHSLAKLWVTIYPSCQLSQCIVLFSCPLISSAVGYVTWIPGQTIDDTLQVGQQFP